MIKCNNSATQGACNNIATQDACNNIATQDACNNSATQDAYSSVATGNTNIITVAIQDSGISIPTQDNCTVTQNTCSCIATQDNCTVAQNTGSCTTTQSVNNSNTNQESDFVADSISSFIKICYVSGKILELVAENVSSSVKNNMMDTHTASSSIIYAASEIVTVTGILRDCFQMGIYRNSPVAVMYH